MLGEPSRSSPVMPGLADSGAVAPGAVPGDVPGEVRVARFERDECVLRRFPVAKRDSLGPFPTAV